MPLYEYSHNAENRIRVSEKTAASVVSGNSEVARSILEQIRQKYEAGKSTVLVAMEGWYGVEWAPLLRGLNDWGKRMSIGVDTVFAAGLFKSKDMIMQYKQPYLTEDPMELVFIDVPDEFSGSVIEKLGQRKGELRNMGASNGGYTRLEFSIPSRGLIGYRGEFMTDTKGNGIMNTIFDDYGPYKGDIQYRKQGSLIAFETGESITYGLFNAQERGTLFIGPGEKVYSGMVVGQNGKSDDIEVNVCRRKQLTNTRASGSDEALKLSPPKVMSLEQCLEFIDTDELLEITPNHLRIRKKILDPKLRKRASQK